MLSYFLLALLFLLTIGIVILILNRYTSFKNFNFILLIVTLAWSFPFSAFFLLPIDLLSTKYDLCLKETSDLRLCVEPVLYIDNKVLYIIWRIVYWTSFVLNWIIIPIMERYLDLGGFNWKRKLRKAILRQLVYLSIVGGIGIVAVVYIVIKNQLNSFQATKSYLIAISNCYGLLLIICFMGYGLIDVPRQFWIYSSPTERLKKMEIQAPILKEKLNDSEYELKQILSIIQLISNKINQQTNQSIQNEFHLILKEFNLDLAYLYELTTTRNNNNNNEVIPDIITEEYLDQIHLKLKRNLKLKERNQAIWEQVLKEAFLIQDIINCSKNSDKKLTSELMILNGSKWDDLKITILWYYYVLIEPNYLKLSSFLFLILSVIILWSELTFKIPNVTLSIIALFFNQLQGAYSLLQLISAILILFMSYCAYSSLFQVKIFNYYVLVPNQHTDSISLLLSGEYLCKLAMPLYYNFLMLAGSASVENSVFYQLMGVIDLVPFLGKFSNYFPLLILIPVLFSIFQWHKKLFNYFSIDNLLLEDQNSIERLREGREILKNERIREERRIQSNITNFERNEVDIFSSRNNSNYNRNSPSRSMAVEVTSNNNSSLYYDSDEEDSIVRNNIKLSTSQKIRRFFSSWKFATISNDRPNSPNVYNNIDSFVDDDNFDEEDIGYLRSIREDS
ncbi:LMBR1-domain-containing protein [Neoconidiobolus thromboides FSU 785]|nr:LMBR1-domain-containing protein [Neoconidiobolus thromboides FSU 785]